ncbi:ribonuclease H-like domain-containing protein [Tanacetum coccineum]
MKVQPSSFNPIPNSIPEGCGGNHGGQSSSDRSQSGTKDNLTLQSMYDLCVSLCKQVTTQAANIKDLKAQIKQLKKKARPGRKTFKSVPTMHKDPSFDDLADAMDYIEIEDAHDEGTVKDSEETKVSTEDDKTKVSTDKLKVSTDKPNEGTAEPNEGTAEPKDGNSDESAAPITVFRDDETIAQFLVSMSQNKAKQKGVEIKDAEDSDRPRPTSTRSLLTLKPLPMIDPKDKGKEVLEEEAESDAESEGVNEVERKFAQLANDEEIARKVQEEWETEEEKKKLAEEEATKAALIRDYDDIQARIESDSILAARLQDEEREKFTIKERAKFLHDTIAAQRKFLAQQRAAEIRSRPPTRTQLRNQMMTYLKHVRGKKHSDLKNKIFEEIQVLYEKVKKSDENFVAIGSTEDERIIRELNKKAAGIKKADSIKEERKEEAGTRKRKLGTRKKMKSRKRRFRHGTSEDDSEKENDELRLYLSIAPDEDKEVDYEILDKKYLIIEWKTEYLGTKPQFNKAKHLEEINLNVVIRSNGQKRYFSTLIRVLSIFDRDDLNAVYQLTRRLLLRCDSIDDLYPVTQQPSSTTTFALLSLSPTMWHRRLGHPSEDVFRRLESSRFISYNKTKLIALCHVCQLGKHTRLPFYSSESNVGSVFDIIHSDLWTSPISSESGIKYYAIFLDHFSHYVWVYPLLHKSDLFDTFVTFRAYVNKQFNVDIKALQCDHGGEYDNTRFHNLFRQNGMQFRFSCPKTSQQNGKSERMLRTLNNITRTLLFQAHKPPSYWVKELTSPKAKQLW